MAVFVVVVVVVTVVAIKLVILSWYGVFIDVDDDVVGGVVVFVGVKPARGARGG